MKYCSIEKHIGIWNLEDIGDYMIGMFSEKYIEETVVMLAIVSQINLMIEIFYLDNESDIKTQFCDFIKRILAWLEKSNTKFEVDDK